VGRRVRVRRVDINQILARGATAASPEATPEDLDEALQQLEPALIRARRLLKRLSATRRDELAEGLLTLADAVEIVVEALSDRPVQAPTNDPDERLNGPTG